MKTANVIVMCFTVLLIVSTASAEPIKVVRGEPLQLRAGVAATFRAPSPVHRIVVGNPNILDVVPQTDRTIALIAKLPGITNFILLDDVGNQIFVGEVVVSTREVAGTVAVHARSSVHSLNRYHCTPTCAYAGTIDSTKVSPATGEEVPEVTYSFTPAPTAPGAAPGTPTTPPARR